MKGWVLAALAIGAVAVWKVVLPRLLSTAAPHAVVLDTDPVQTPMEPPEQLTVLRDGRVYRVEKQHAYEVQGEVLSASSYDVTWTNDFADVDVGLIWGPRRKQLKDRFKFFQMGRWLFWRTDTEPSQEDRAEVTTHISNNHLIPAEGSQHLGWAFRRISKGDVVRLKGWLVRITSAKGDVYAQSSTRRDDTGDGACEVVWVEELQVGNRLFR